MKELKGGRVMLVSGESQTISFTLDKAAISSYDSVVHDWVAQPGQFTVPAGTSSRDIRAKGGFGLARKRVRDNKAQAAGRGCAGVAKPADAKGLKSPIGSVVVSCYV